MLWQEGTPKFLYTFWPIVSHKGLKRHTVPVYQELTLDPGEVYMMLGPNGVPSV